MWRIPVLFQTSPWNITQVLLQRLNSLQVPHIQVQEVMGWTYICKAHNTSHITAAPQAGGLGGVATKWSAGSRCCSHYSSASGSAHCSTYFLPMIFACHWLFTHQLMWTSTWLWAQEGPVTNRIWLCVCLSVCLPLSERSSFLCFWNPHLCFSNAVKLPDATGTGSPSHWKAGELGYKQFSHFYSVMDWWLSLHVAKCLKAVTTFLLGLESDSLGQEAMPGGLP